MKLFSSSTATSLLAVFSIVLATCGQNLRHHDLVLQTESLLVPELQNLLNENRHLQGDLVCNAINNVLDKVICECQQTSITCTYQETICVGGETNSTSATCGRPQVSLDLFDTTAQVQVCVLDMVHESIQNQDFCVAVQAGFTMPPSCTAELDGQACNCTVCENDAFVTSGTIFAGLSIDCRNVNAEAKTVECQPFDDYRSIFDNNGEGFGGFVPNWQGYCTKLQEAADGVIDCDCSQASGPDFWLECKANATEFCDSLATARDGLGLCDYKVNSNVTVVNDTVTSIEACIDTDVTGVLCASVTACDAINSDICSCAISKDGSPCTCEICDGGIRVNCSAVPGGIVWDQCQPVNTESAFTFVPVATSRQVSQNDGEGDVNEGTSSDASLTRNLWFGTAALIASALVL